MSEKKILERFISQVQDGDCFWDIGAAVGTYSCLAAAAGATPIAFEPHPENYDRCQENFELNDASGEVREVALGDKNESLSLIEDRGVGTGKHRISTDGDRMISVVRGDEVAARDPDIIKIDVEGSVDHIENVLTPPVEIESASSMRG